MDILLTVLALLGFRFLHSNSTSTNETVLKAKGEAKTFSFLLKMLESEKRNYEFLPPRRLRKLIPHESNV